MLVNPPSPTPITFGVHPSTTPTSAVAREKALKDLKFGRVFTDHMVTLRWKADRGWFDGKIEARSAFTLDPAAMVLHYGQAVFEGFKAYHQADGGVATFRPHEHARRFAASCQRLAMPQLPEQAFVDAADALIKQDRAWVPRLPEQSLYLRPFMLATEACLGVRPASEYLFSVIASPAGAYFAGGARAVSVWLTQDYIRAAPGGTGAAKCAGNYAGSLVAQAEAAEQGCDQVLWTDTTHTFVEEMGGMNVFFVFRTPNGPVLTTPSLESGTLLPGMTRRSVLALAKEQGLAVEERQLRFDEIGSAIDSGTLEEAFACGTAAVITPIGAFKSSTRTWRLVPEDAPNPMGPIAGQLRERLLGIQHGQLPDPHGWVHRVDV